jgi:NADH-quinone oxidoreductase subunit M
MILLPLACGFGLSMLNGRRPELVRGLSLAVSVVVLVLALVAAKVFNWQDPGAFQLNAQTNWVPTLGVSFSFGIDAISLWLVILTAFLLPVTLLGTWNDVTHRVKEYYLWLLVLQGAMIGVFVVRDIILFYVFFELTLLPLYFLIGVFGSGDKKFIATKFFLFTLAGSVFTFLGIIYVAYFNAHTLGNPWSFAMEDLIAAGAQMPTSAQGYVLGAFCLGFAVKVPLFPVHTWLPLAHTAAPTAGSAILAGVLLKLGTYGLLRIAIPAVPDAVVEYAPLIGVLSIIGILYTALICWVQTDIKKLVAYSSVSHMGFCVLGMFALNQTGIGGSVMYMINHGLSTGALFLCVGMIYVRYHTRQMDDLQGIARQMPIWGSFMVFFCLSSVGLPGLNGFVGEFLTLFGTFQADEAIGLGPIYAAVAAIGLILGAIYILYMVGKVCLGPVKEPDAYAGKIQDLNGIEIASLAPIAVLCLVLGLYPTPVLESLEDSITNLTQPARQVIQIVEQQQREGATLLASQEVSP